MKTELKVGQTLDIASLVGRTIHGVARNAADPAGFIFFLDEDGDPFVGLQAHQLFDPAFGSFVGFEALPLHGREYTDEEKYSWPSGRTARTRSTGGVGGSGPTATDLDAKERRRARRAARKARQAGGA